jgi:hypothetical protein
MVATIGCRRVLRSASILILTSATSASAAEHAAPLFPQGTFTLQSSANYAKGLEARQEDIWSLDVGGGYFVFDNLSLNVEFSAYRAIQTGEDAWIGGVAGVMRHHLFTFADRYSIFGDVSFGPTFASDEVPFDGTRFNFITRVGAGATARLSDDLHLMFGVRYFHLSNARIHGKDENPSINGVEGYVGLMWLIR